MINVLFQFIAISFFLSGYYRVKQEYSDFNQTPTSNQNPKKVVFMLIDALRYDLLVNSDFRFYNEITKLYPNNTLLFRSRATTPTVTMLNIKSMMIGNYPSFIQFSLNTAAQEVIEDNVIEQLIRNGKKCSFLGDETWLKLFPNQFDIAHGMDAFDVHDIDSSDNVIEKYLIEYIESQNYTFMVSHFAGIDHIGHLFHDAHQGIQQKQEEYSQFLWKVYQAIDNDTILMLVSDHGMTTRGNHGGDSEQELDAVLFAISKSQYYMPSSQTRTIEQIDIAPTLSYLLGIPIPFSNIGMIINEFTNSSTMSCQENIYQIWNLIQKLQLESKKFNSQKYEMWNQQIQQAKSCLEYNKIIQDIQQSIKQLSAVYDTQYMIIGLIISLTTIIFTGMRIFEKLFGLQLLSKSFYLIYKYELLFLSPLWLIFSLEWNNQIFKIIGIYIEIILLKSMLTYQFRISQLSKIIGYFTNRRQYHKFSNFKYFFFTTYLVVQNALYLLMFNRQANPTVNTFCIIFTSLIILLILNRPHLKQFLIIITLMLYAHQYDSVLAQNEPKSILHFEIPLLFNQLFQYIIPAFMILRLIRQFYINQGSDKNKIHQCLLNLALAIIFIYLKYHYLINNYFFNIYLPQFIYFYSIGLATYYKDLSTILPMILTTAGENSLTSITCYLYSVKYTTQFLDKADKNWYSIVMGGLLQSLTYYYWFTLGNRFQFSNVKVGNAFIGIQSYNFVFFGLFLALSIVIFFYIIIFKVGIFMLNSLAIQIIEQENKTNQCRYVIQVADVFYQLQLFFQFLHNLLNLYNVLLLMFAQKLIFDLLIYIAFFVFRMPFKQYF